MLTKRCLLFEIIVHFNFVIENNINSISLGKDIVFIEQIKIKMIINDLRKNLKN